MEADKLKELHTAELRILRDFHEVCNRLGIRYFACFGTAIGAVRHQGFIPWDDDIDVGMLRDDYEKFRREAPKHLPSRLFLQNYDTDNDYWLQHAKLRDSKTTFIEEGNKEYNWNHGVFIDIFPFDYVPENKWQRWKVKFKEKYYHIAISVLKNKELFVHFGWKNLLRLILKVLFNIRFSSRAEIAQCLDSMLASISPSKLVCCYEGSQTVYKKEWFDEVQSVRFESTTINLPVGYHEALSKLYGDYMTPPPTSQRVPVHVAAVVDIDRPYTYYRIATAPTK